MANALMGIILKICSTIVFVMMGLCIRYLSENYPTGEIVFFRSVFAIPPLIIFAAAQGRFAEIYQINDVGGHIYRGVVGVTAMACGFYALGYISLADLTGINYLAPLASVVFAVVILGEKVRIYRWSAVGIGFIGVIIMLSPHLGFGRGGEVDAATRYAVIIATIGAVLMALAFIAIRRLTVTETTMSIVFYFSVISTGLALLTLPFGWEMPGLFDLLILVLSGLLGGVAQIMLTTAYRYTETSLIAPFEYISMIWAVLAGYYAFGDLPAIEVYIGALFVVSAGIFIIWRETRLGLFNTKARKVRTPHGG